MDTTSTAPAGTGGAPVLVSSQQARGGGGGGGGHGDVGPVIGVLAVIGVLGIIAGLIGRLCSGRTIMGYGPHIDVEAWLESKFSSCLDGHVPTAVNANPRFPHPHVITPFPTGAATPTAAAFRPPNLHLHLHRPQQLPVPSNINATSHSDSDSVSNSDISADEVVHHQQKLRLQRQAQNHDDSRSVSDHHEELNNHHPHQQQRPHHMH